MRHYLDYNATAPLRPQVLAVMQELQGLPLNASSVHALGRKAKSILEDSRRCIAEAVGAFANEVAFTAFVSAIEHSSVLKTAAGPTLIPVTADGVIDLASLKAMLPPSNDFIVSVMLANNETGVIQPVQEVAALVHAQGGLLHCDAVQALGKIPVDFTALDCDFMTLSAHKMGGPIGAAVLVVKNNLAIAPMLKGGGQELNRRAGTENIAAIAGFAKAAECMDFSQMKTLRGWLDVMEKEMEALGRVRGGVLHDDLAGSVVPPIKVLGKNIARLPNTSCLTMPSVSAETQLISFDLEGIAVSTGSACSSGRIEPSHVLKAMGVADTEAATAIRISGGWATTAEDITSMTAVWKKLFQRKAVA